MEVTRTETYNTAAGGTNTVFVVEPFDRERLVQILATASEAADEQAAAETKAEREQQEAEEAKLWRTWTSGNGQFTVEAKLLSLAVGKAELEKRDGTAVDVELDILSPEDREFVEEWKRARR